MSRGRYEKASDEEVDARFKVMPAALAAALLPFQREGVRYALRRGGRALIADEMGVGKTVQAIALAACCMVRHHAPVLTKYHICVRFISMPIKSISERPFNLRVVIKTVLSTMQ